MASERKFIQENVKRLLLKEYLMKKVSRAGFGGLDIQRTPLGTQVKLIIERPGLVIGKRGATIKDLTTVLERDFEFDHPQIAVEEVKNPSLNPHIMAYKLAESLERGWHFRRAGHSTVRRIMEAGAVGCQVVLSGKLTGQRHRVEKFKEGHIKFCGEPRQLWVHEGFATAIVKLGVIGVKVQITDPNTRLPDEITVVDTLPEEEKEEHKKEGEEAAEDEAKPVPEKKEKKTRSRKSRAKKKEESPEKDEEKPAEPAADEPESKKKPEPTSKADVEQVEKEGTEEDKPAVSVEEKKEAAGGSSEEKKTDKDSTETPAEAPAVSEKVEVTEETPAPAPKKKEKVEKEDVEKPAEAEPVEGGESSANDENQ